MDYHILSIKFTGTEVVFPLSKYLLKVNSKGPRITSVKLLITLTDISRTIYTHMSPKPSKSPKLPQPCKHNKYTTNVNTYSALLFKLFSFKNMWNDGQMEWMFPSVFISDINNITHNFHDT